MVSHVASARVCGTLSQILIAKASWTLAALTKVQVIPDDLWLSIRTATYRSSLFCNGAAMSGLCATLDHGRCRQQTVSGRQRLCR